MPYQIKNGIIYSGNAVTLTQAEYDALTEAEKKNGTVYYISDSSAVMDASDVGIDGGGNLQDLVGSVATIETSPATAIHAVGDYIVYNGQLYEVTAAIAVGETLTVGTNISATTVGSELSGLMYESTTTTDNYGTVYKCKKYNNGDIEISDVVDIVFRGSPEGPYNGMYRSRETRSFPILTRIDGAFAQGTNSNVFISSTQTISGNNNTILYVAQSVNTIAQGLAITSTSVLIRGRWK